MSGRQTPRALTPEERIRIHEAPMAEVLGFDPAHAPAPDQADQAELQAESAGRRWERSAQNARAIQEGLRRSRPQRPEGDPLPRRSQMSG